MRVQTTVAQHLNAHDIFVTFVSVCTFLDFLGAPRPLECKTYFLPENGFSGCTSCLSGVAPLVQYSSAIMVDRQEP